MKSIIVKELMVPLNEYATVSPEATLYEAIIALEESHATLEPSQYKHRAILVLNQDGEISGKLSMKDILIALEPQYGKIAGMGVLNRSGFSTDLIKSMLKDNTLWIEPLEFICERASQLKVKDFVCVPEEDELIDENASLGEAIHQLVMFPFLSLLVTRANRFIGILRLSDVFTKICDKIKTCES